MPDPSQQPKVPEEPVFDFNFKMKMAVAIVDDPYEARIKAFRAGRQPEKSPRTTVTDYDHPQQPPIL